MSQSSVVVSVGTDPHRVAERISERVFVLEVDGIRLNISIKCMLLWMLQVAADITPYFPLIDSEGF